MYNVEHCTLYIHVDALLSRLRRGRSSTADVNSHSNDGEKTSTGYENRIIRCEKLSIESSRIFHQFSTDCECDIVTHHNSTSVIVVRHLPRRQMRLIYFLLLLLQNAWVHALRSSNKSSIAFKKQSHRRIESQRE